MLFRKEMEPRCSYCAKSTEAEGEYLICVKRGIVSGDHHCRLFQYDPLRRIPSSPAPLKTQGLSASDFSLEDF